VQTAYNFRQKHHQEIDEALEYATSAGMGIVGMKAIAASVKKYGNKVPGIAKTALKWALQNKNIHTNIPGFTTFDQLHTDLSVMEDLALTPQEKKDIELTKTYAGLYCQLCAECLPQCPHGLYVPALMRSYMYAYGYKNLQAAKEATDSLDLSALPCQDCQSCGVKCAMGFDIKTRAVDIARIKDVEEAFLA
jgi:predicted aldo/keto reductase-like oxidoreductase